MIKLEKQKADASTSEKFLSIIGVARENRKEKIS